MQVLFLNFNFLIICGTNLFWENLPILKVIKYASFSKKDWPSLFPDMITYVGSNVFQAPIWTTLGKKRYNHAKVQSVSECRWFSDRTLFA